jgi:hypothetical protein
MGGGLSVLASWLAQRVQSKSQLLAQEIRRRQQVYSDFVDAAASCFAHALQEDEPETKTLSRLYREIGRMRLYSIEMVVREANEIAHKILNTYAATNRGKAEIRELLAHDSIDLFSNFSNACRVEMARLQTSR